MNGLCPHVVESFISPYYGFYLRPNFLQCTPWTIYRKMRCSQFLYSFFSSALVHENAFLFFSQYRASLQLYDRRRSQRDLFPYNRRRSQTIAEPTVAIHFVQRKCHMYSRVVLAGKSKQTTWRTSRRKFCCKQIYFFF